MVATVVVVVIDNDIVVYYVICFLPSPPHIVINGWWWVMVEEATCSVSFQKHTRPQQQLDLIHLLHVHHRFSSSLSVSHHLFHSLHYHSTHYFTSLTYRLSLSHLFLSLFGAMSSSKSKRSVSGSSAKNGAARTPPAPSVPVVGKSPKFYVRVSSGRFGQGFRRTDAIQDGPTVRRVSDKAATPPPATSKKAELSSVSSVHVHVQF
jgi:hypothetical protein